MITIASQAAFWGSRCTQQWSITCQLPPATMQRRNFEPLTRHTPDTYLLSVLRNDMLTCVYCLLNSPHNAEPERIYMHIFIRFMFLLGLRIPWFSCCTTSLPVPYSTMFPMSPTWAFSPSQNDWSCQGDLLREKSSRGNSKIVQELCSILYSYSMLLFGWMWTNV